MSIGMKEYPYFYFFEIILPGFTTPTDCGAQTWIVNNATNINNNNNSTDASAVIPSIYSLGYYGNRIEIDSN